MRKEHAERDGVTYKLETRKMMSGLPRESFSIMVLPLGHKMDLDLCATPHYLAPGGS
jgi:hypothetical protein